MEYKKGQFYSSIMEFPEYPFASFFEVVAVFEEQEIVLAGYGSNSWYSGVSLSPNNRTLYTFAEFKELVKDKTLYESMPDAPPKPLSKELEDAERVLRSHGKVRKFMGFEFLGK